MISKIKEKIFKITNDLEFEKIALEIFKFQSEKNIIYKKYIDFLKIDKEKITKLSQIPFLPIEFFKSKKIVTTLGDIDPEYTVFKSSGTTGSNRSQHFVSDLKLYEKSFFNGFESNFGSVENYVIIGLLPSYLESGESSLVYMVNKLILASKNVLSGFFLNKLDELPKHLEELEKQNKKVVLFGVTYALLELASKISHINLNNIIIIETGGMKGRRKEITREELHEILKRTFNQKHIYSEYGMTELLSQAYLMESGLFYPSSTMKILIRDVNDPFTYLEKNKSGGINIIDLANVLSCSFIETKDLGRSVNSGFEVLGRFDDSDIRGCNLLIS